MLPYIILGCILVLSEESPPPIKVGNLERGITIVNYDKATNGFSVDTSDHFLVQKFHDIDHFGAFPWKCTLEFENGASVEQFFKNPRLDVETLEFEEIDKVHLKFKGVFGEEKVLKCYEKTSGGTFEQVIYSDKRVVMETGVGSSGAQTEIRWYQKACESESMESMGCDDYYFVMPVVGDGYENKEEFFTKAIEGMDFLLSVEPYKKYRSWFHIPMVWGEALAHRKYFGSGNSALCNPSTSTLTRWLEDHDIFSDVITLFIRQSCRGNFNGVVATTGGVSADSHHSWRDTPVHEFAHSLGLADEYTEVGKCRDPIPAGNSPNLDMSGSIETSKWAHWQDSPDVGYWEGGRFCENGVFRPMLISPMSGGRIYDVDYCAVHKEALVLGLASMVEYIHSISPAIPENPPSSCSDAYSYCGWYADNKYCTRYESWMRTYCKNTCGHCPQEENTEPRIKLNEAVDEPKVFAVTHSQTDAGTIEVSWDLDGVVVGMGDSYTVDVSQLEKGRRELTVTVEDTTDLVRKDPENVLRETRTWVLELISTDADADATYDCVLPETQIGYAIDIGATLQLCNSNFCKEPFMSGVQCADGYDGFPTTAGCATSQTMVRLTGCSLHVEPTFMPTTPPTESIEFVTLTTGHCSDEGRIMDPIICRMAAESVGLKFRGYVDMNRFPVGCAYTQNEVYINNPEQVFVTDKNWPELCLAEFDASKEAEETTPPDFTNCLATELDNEYALGGGSNNFLVTNEKITFNGKLVGVGSYEAGVYTDGANCDVSQSEDKMSATLRFDYREACVYNHVQEPTPCVFVITICLKCRLLSEDKTEIYQLTKFNQLTCRAIEYGCKPIGTEEKCSEIANMLGKPSVSRVHSGGVPGGCIYRSVENAVEFNTNLYDSSYLGLTYKLCICPAVKVEAPACLRSKDYGNKCGRRVSGAPGPVYCTQKLDCCSKHGWCGTSSAHCNLYSNQHSNYGGDKCSNTLVPASPTGRWVIGPGDQSCGIACADIFLVCTAAGLSDHNNEVDTAAKMLKIIKDLGGTTSSSCYGGYGNGAPQPSFKSNECYHSSPNRAANTFDCGAAPSPSGSGKKRLCYCSAPAQQDTEAEVSGRGRDCKSTEVMLYYTSVGPKCYGHGSKTNIPSTGVKISFITVPRNCKISLYTMPQGLGSSQTLDGSRQKTFASEIQGKYAKAGGVRAVKVICRRRAESQVGILGRIETSTGSLVESESALGSRQPIGAAEQAAAHIAKIDVFQTTMIYIFAVFGLISTIIIVVKGCRNKNSGGFTKIDDVEI